ncbi:MAG TPA: hypothetical protein VJG32_10580 [Anaerolineae bacterium]|nr:hypothetical protein [Anaerolineae bacterium]
MINAGLKQFLVFLALAGLSAAVYVGLATTGGSSGFPLDDAWIHQTYARNLAGSGQLAYVPGQPSAGSTSPLWTLLIAIGYKLNIDTRLWTYALGAISLALTAWFLTRLSLRLWPDRPRLALAAGLLCLFEWHLAWAAASGMETVLFTALALALMERAVQARASWRDGLIFGALGGLLTVTRPEGLLLVGLAGLAVLARSRAGGRSQESLISAAGNFPRFVVASFLGFGVFVLPAAWLNWQASGTPFPNTFYAKQQEYAGYFSSFAAWLPRALAVVSAPFIGPQVLLAPGFLRATFSTLRRLPDRTTWPRALPIVWVVAHLGVYAARLPVTYQHGRYLIPVIPVILLFGLHSSVGWLRRWEGWRREGRHREGWHREGRHREMPPTGFLRRVGIGSLFAAAAAFWLVGAGAYRVDVNVIETELVASAQWIAMNTAPDALVAAHDIGAIGYFARRPLLDLAGLISPEVIPIIRDEAALSDLLRARRADYLAAPPDFYTTLLAAPELEPVFAGAAPFMQQHWQVFRLSW